MLRHLLGFVLGFALLSCGPAKNQQDSQPFPVGQNVLFEKITLVASSKTDYEEMTHLLSANHPVDMMISMGRAYYVEPQTRASVIEQQDDSIRVLISEGARNGYRCWTSKQSLTKAFPILPPG
jgi:hypothetical protein